MIPLCETGGLAVHLTGTMSSALGSARVPRAADGVAPSASFINVAPPFGASKWGDEVCSATPQTTRRRRVLPVPNRFKPTPRRRSNIKFGPASFTSHLTRYSSYHNLSASTPPRGGGGWPAKTWLTVGGAHGICERGLQIGLCGCFQNFFGPSPVEKGVNRCAERTCLNLKPKSHPLLISGS